MIMKVTGLSVVALCLLGLATVTVAGSYPEGWFERPAPGAVAPGVVFAVVALVTLMAVGLTSRRPTAAPVYALLVGLSLVSVSLEYHLELAPEAWRTWTIAAGFGFVGVGLVLTLLSLALAEGLDAFVAGGWLGVGGAASVMTELVFPSDGPAAVNVTAVAILTLAAALVLGDIGDLLEDTRWFSAAWGAAGAGGVITILVAVVSFDPAGWLTVLLVVAAVLWGAVTALAAGAFWADRQPEPGAGEVPRAGARATADPLRKIPPGTASGGTILPGSVRGRAAARLPVRYGSASPPTRTRDRRLLDHRMIVNTVIAGIVIALVSKILDVVVD